MAAPLICASIIFSHRHDYPPHSRRDYSRRTDLHQQLKLSRTSPRRNIHAPTPEAIDR